jgi:hypothetical protein
VSPAEQALFRGVRALLLTYLRTSTIGGKPLLEGTVGVDRAVFHLGYRQMRSMIWSAADLGAWVCFEDGSGQGSWRRCASVLLRPPKGRTWRRRGRTPVVTVTGEDGDHQVPQNLADGRRVPWLRYRPGERAWPTAA